VARSNLHCLRKLGAHVTVTGPATMIPPGIESLGCRVARRLEDAVDGADVIMMLRIQHERGASPMLPSLREYSRTFGLTLDKLSLAAPDAIVMHPGPVNRGVEISVEVADGPRSVILEQVERGVAVRMAVLCKLLGVQPGTSRSRSSDGQEVRA
jgi:aspartate carbamoyltransferase catalytic subunit